MNSERNHTNHVPFHIGSFLNGAISAYIAGAEEQDTHPSSFEMDSS